MLYEPGRAPGTVQDTSPIGAPYPTEPSQRPVTGPPPVPPGPWPPDAGLLVVQTGHYRFAGTGWTRPWVNVDGYEYRSRWGSNAFVLPAGLRKVTVGGPGLPATTVAGIAPGRQTVLHYASPLNIFARARLAPTPQRAPCIPFYLTVLGLTALMLLLLAGLLVFVLTR